MHDLSGPGGARPGRTPAPSRDLVGAIVAVDAGHPSENGHGAQSPAGTIESHMTLAVAKKLERLLRERGATVVMTRTEIDELVTNRERAEIANRARAHLFVRLHCDARTAAGTATYYPDRQGTTPEGVTGPSDEVIARSEALAKVFHPSLVAAMGSDWNDVGIMGDSRTAVGSRQGALTGSIFSQVPAVTIEMISLRNESDDAFINTDEGQERMARALLAGIEAYLRSPASGWK
jgi:N-acetylmuramoyl-L-alanine amidase